MKKIALLLVIVIALTFVCSCDLRATIDEMSDNLFNRVVELAEPYLKEDTKFSNEDTTIDSEIAQE